MSNKNIENLIIASRIHSDSLGFFCSKEVAIGILSENQLLSPYDVELFLKQTPNHETQLKMALASVVYIHEMRHLHDSFGTLGGMAIFFSWLSLARHFLKLIRELRSSGQKLYLPFTSWAKMRNCPSIVREFIHRASLLGSVLVEYIGIDNDSNNTQGLDDLEGDIVYRMYSNNDLQFEYPFYNYRWMLGNNLKSTFVPVGLESLLEGSAHAIQRDILNLWPENIQNDVHNRLYAEIIHDGNGINVKPLPYNITDLLITRVLQQLGGNNYTRGTLLSLTDYALMSGFLNMKSRRSMKINGTELYGLVVHPGNIFLKKLESMSRIEIEQNKASLEIENDAIQHIRDIMAREPDPDSFNELFSYKGRIPLEACIEALDSIIRHKIIVPLFDIRIKYGNEIFRNSIKYIQHFDELPGPLATFISGKTYLMNNNFARIWSLYCLLIDTISQIISGNSILSCYRMKFPILENVNLAFEGNCSIHLQSQKCGYWEKNRPSLLPGCLFSQMIDLLELDP